MSDWTLEELSEWDKRICDVSRESGLDWYEIAYETCDYFEMIGNMSYHGMPSHFPHWSYGKSFERTRSYDRRFSSQETARSRKIGGGDVSTSTGADECRRTGSTG